MRGQGGKSFLKLEETGKKRTTENLLSVGSDQTLKGARSRQSSPFGGGKGLQGGTVMKEKGSSASFSENGMGSGLRTSLERLNNKEGVKIYRLGN